MTRSALLAPLAAAWLAPAAAGANPVDLFGFGARAPAMGGAQTAATDDGGANYYNPAALALPEEIRIDLGYQLAQPWLSIDGGGQDVDQSRGLVAALSAPGKVGGLRLALGAAVVLPDERIARVRTLPAGRPRWSSYDNRPQRIFLASNLAFRIGRHVAVGGGIAYMSRTAGTVDLAGRVGFPNYEDSDLTLGIDVDLKTVRYPQAGILVHARPWLDLGLAYRHKFVAEFDQAFRIDGDIGPEGVAPIVDDGYFFLHSISADLFQPAQLAFGFSARLTPRLLVAGDVTWARWSAFENPAAHIQLELDLKQFQDLVKIPPNPALPGVFFHDTLAPRLGVEYTAAARRHAVWRLRGGYAWEPTPTPEQSGETNFVDNDKHTLSLGLGVEIARVTDLLPRPFDLDLYAAGTFLPERTHHKFSPVDPVGDYRARGFVLATGVMTRWHF